MGGEGQDGSRMIVVCETCACLHWVWGDSQENFKFTSASDAIWDKLSEQNFDDTYVCSVTCKQLIIITILNFNISGERKL